MMISPVSPRRRLRQLARKHLPFGICSIGQLRKQALAVRPRAESGIDIDVARRAGIDEARAPGECNFARTRETHIRIVPAADDDAAKC